MVRRMAPVSGSISWICDRGTPHHRLPSAQASPIPAVAGRGGSTPLRRRWPGSILSMRASAIWYRVRAVEGGAGVAARSSVRAAGRSRDRRRPAWIRWRPRRDGRRVVTPWMRSAPQRGHTTHDLAARTGAAVSSCCPASVGVIAWLLAARFRRRRKTNLPERQRAGSNKIVCEPPAAAIASAVHVRADGAHPSGGLQLDECALDRALLARGPAPGPRWTRPLRRRAAPASTLIAIDSVVTRTRRRARPGVSVKHARWPRCAPPRGERAQNDRSRRAGALGATRWGGGRRTRARSVCADRRRRATPRRAHAPTRIAPAGAPAAAKWHRRAGRDGRRRPPAAPEASSASTSSSRSGCS